MPDKRFQIRKMLENESEIAHDKGFVTKKNIFSQIPWWDSIGFFSVTLKNVVNILILIDILIIFCLIVKY